MRSCDPKRAAFWIHSRAQGIRIAAEDLITYSGDGHLITFAPTGMGKTSGPVICNALTHPGQLVVLDMKGEVYAKTGDARRAMGQEVHVLDLRDGEHTDSLNPLDLVSRCGADPAALGRSFAAELIERGNERERFWNDWSETMIAGATAWLSPT
jgi:type IV secretion system protein VirD4